MEVRKQRHKDWRKNAKKAQRKRRRRSVAAKREQDLKKRQQSSSYQMQLEQDRITELVELETIERMNELENEKWIEYELLIEKKWQMKKKKMEELAKKEADERRRIQEEFEAEQNRIALAEEEKKRLIELEQERQLDLERRIRKFVDGIGKMPQELLLDADTNPGKGECPFFVKTAACRFGHKCVRNHKRPKISHFLLIQSFFTNIHLEQSASTEYGNLTLELDENELYQHFLEFFNDIVPEFGIFGRIKHVAVCSNYEPHLRGNVLIEYSLERDAMKTQQVMNGRYYAGRMLNVEFRRIAWKSAVCGRSNIQHDGCEHSNHTVGQTPDKPNAHIFDHEIGLSLKNACTKGRNCSFLHIFKNPAGRYSVEKAIMEMKSVTQSQRNGTQKEDNDGWNFNGEQTKKNWRWSESPIKEVVETNVSRINSGKTRRSQIRSPSHHRSVEQSKERCRQRSRSRSRTRSKTRNGSDRRSRSKHRHDTRKRSRTRSRSKTRSQSRRHSTAKSKRSRSRDKLKSKHKKSRKCKD